MFDELFRKQGKLSGRCPLRGSPSTDCLVLSVKFRVRTNLNLHSETTKAMKFEG